MLRLLKALDLIESKEKGTKNLPVLARDLRILNFFHLFLKMEHDSPFALYFVFDPCEENFSHSPYVAEWWGTWSSLCFFIVAIFGCRRPVPPRVLHCYLSTIPIGITSTIHHMTLSPFTQFCDELAIVIAECIYLRALHIEIPCKPAIAVLCALGIFHPLPLGIVIFSLLGTIFSTVVEMKAKYPQLVTYCNLVLLCSVLSLVCLVMDFVACSGPQWLRIPYHSVWHVVMAAFCTIGALALEKRHYINKYF